MDPTSSLRSKKTKVKKSTKADDSSFNDDTPVTVEDLRELKLKQLKKIAKDRKISYNKADIVEKEDIVQVLVTSGKINMKQERKASFGGRFFGGGSKKDKEESVAKSSRKKEAAAETQTASSAGRFLGRSSKKDKEASVPKTSRKKEAAPEEQPPSSNGRFFGRSSKKKEESVLNAKGRQAAAKEERPWNTDEDDEHVKEKKGSLFEMNRKKWIIVGIVVAALIAVVVVIVAVVGLGGGGDSSPSASSASAGNGSSGTAPTPAPAPSGDIFAGDDDDDDTNTQPTPTDSSPSQPSPTPPSPTTPAPVPPPTTSQPTVTPLRIVLLNVGTTNNADYDAALRRAADRWEKVVVDVLGNGFVLPTQEWFNGYFDNTSFNPGNFPVDDKAILIGYDFVEEEGVFVGQGTPSRARSSGGVPIATRSGGMKFDASEFAGMDEEERYFTASHEIGHVLGIGTIRQSGCWSRTCVEDNLIDYPCPNAAQAFADLGISSDPLRVDGGFGACSHWDESVFNSLSWSDIMTPAYNGQPQLLTTFDIGAVEDIGGYVVNYDAADPIPSSRRSLRGIAPEGD